MATLIDTSVWVDFTRSRSSKGLKQFIAPFVLHADARVAEPVRFEFAASRHPERGGATIPGFADSSHVGYAIRCLDGGGSTWPGMPRKRVHRRFARPPERQRGASSQSEVITFDENFRRISEATGLRVKVLSFPPE